MNCLGTANELPRYCLWTAYVLLLRWTAKKNCLINGRQSLQSQTEKKANKLPKYCFSLELWRLENCLRTAFHFDMGCHRRVGLSWGWKIGTGILDQATPVIWQVRTSLYAYLGQWSWPIETLDKIQTRAKSIWSQRRRCLRYRQTCDQMDRGNIINKLFKLKKVINYSLILCEVSFEPNNLLNSLFLSAPCFKTPLFFFVYKQQTTMYHVTKFIN